MKPPKITIAGHDYRLTPTPPGKNGCHLCALLLWCYDNADNMPCVDFAKDCHFIKENHEDNSRNADNDSCRVYSSDDGHRDSGNAAPFQ